MVPYISIVIPVFNEEDNIINLWNRLRTVLNNYSLDKKRAWEVIFIDDGSRDNSLTILQEVIRHEPAVSIVEFNRNYGQHAAMLAAFTIAQGKIIVTMDANLQNPPEEIPKLVAKVEEGFDVVGGLRKELIHKDRLSKSIQAKIINIIARKATGVELHDYGCTLRAYRREVVDAILLCKEHCRLIPLLANTFAKHVIEIPVQYSDRLAGDSKYSLWKSIELQFELIANFSIIPLQTLAVLGVAISTLSVISAIITLMHHIFYYEGSSGIPILFNIIFFCMGAQFIAFGLLGEYVRRIHQEVYNRPRYIIRNIHKTSLYK